MDEKTQRYMQRIQKIMLTPKKVSSQFRPSKSPINCKPNKLDEYLKYQLSTTIIQNIVRKYNQQFVSQFFNSIKTSEYRHKERIYKFIPVEKNQKKHNNVDPAISGKILRTALKSIFRRKYVEFINALQEVSKSSQSAHPITNKIQRKRPQRQPQSYAVLVRTTTKPELSNYRIVDQWIDGSSNKDYIKNQLSEKIQKQHTKQVVKTIDSKIKTTLLTCFYKIQYFVSRKQANALPVQSKQPSTKQTPKVSVKQLPKTQIMNPKQVQKLYKSSRSTYIMINLIKKYLSSVLNTVKTKSNQRYRRIQTHFLRVYQVTNNLHFNSKLRNLHFFFNQIKPSLQIELSSSRMSDQLSSNIGSQALSNRSSKPIPIFPTIPKAEDKSLKVNFDSFVDKIIKFVAIVSKKLIPLKQAFVKIDCYASFSYRLEQSLKVAPKRYLLESFRQIKQYIPEEIVIPQPSQAHLKFPLFYEKIVPIILQRLIEGFIHIKIVHRKPSLTLTAVKDSIIQDTIKFIRAREQHSSNSFQNWNQLKSILLSPPSSQIRPQSKILI